MAGRRNGSGGAGGRGGSADLGGFLRQNGETEKGLFFSAKGADLTWHLRAESKDAADPAIGSHVDLRNNPGSGVDRVGALRLHFAADIAGYAGVLSNNITVRLFRDDTISSSPTVSWTAATGLVLIVLGPNTTIANVRDAIDNANLAITITHSVTGAAIGSDNLRLPAANGQHNDHQASGGRNAIPPSIEVIAQPEDAVNGPNILVKYDATDTLQDVLDDLEENDQGVTITVRWGTDMTANPEAPPFARGFGADPGVGVAPAPATSGLNRNQVDARIDAKVKGYALSTGGDVPDSELPDGITRDSEVETFARASSSDKVPEPKIPAAITRDNEVTSIVAAVASQDLRDQLDDEVLYVGTGGNVHKTTVTKLFQKLGLSVAFDEASREFTLTTPAGDRVATIPGARDSVTSISFDSGTGELSVTQRGGHVTSIVLGGRGSNVTANPAGTDGDPLLRLEIDGVNWVVGGEVPVGMGLLVGRVTSTAGKLPANLPDHTDPIRVPIPVYGDLTDVEAGGTDGDGTAAAMKAASIDWPVVPLTAIGAAGGFLSNLDTNDGSVEIQEGMYIVGLRAQNVWVNDLGPGANWRANPATAEARRSARAPDPARICAELLIEYLDGSTWVELSKSFSPYTRRAPYARETTTSGGTVSTAHPGSRATADVAGTPTAGAGDPDYDGTISPVTATMYSVISIPPGGLTVRFRMERGDVMLAAQRGATSPIEYTDDGFVKKPTTAASANDYIGRLDGGTMPWGFFCDIPGISIFPLGRPTQTQPIIPRPHISRFASTSGDLNPVAGSIATNTYGYEYSIAQGSHAGTARIIGFKGDTKPVGSTTTLATLTNLDHGTGTVTIPNGITLAAGEKYRLRLQLFADGVTPGADTAPIGYQDIVITAHAAAAAKYHVGLVAYDANDADAAATAARITDFTGDTSTAETLPSSLVIAVPGTAGNTDEFQLYLLAKEGESQPSGFTSAGLPANTSFYAAQDVTINSVTYKAYILKPVWRVTKSDNGDSFGVTS